MLLSLPLKDNIRDKVKMGVLQKVDISESLIQSNKTSFITRKKQTLAYIKKLVKNKLIDIG